MDRLILLRHGKAEAESPSGRDFDRGLTQRGRRDAALTAQALAEAGFHPDLVLVSTAARAAQTWGAAASVFPDARVEETPALYDIAPGEILALVRGEGAEVGTVMVVGHNPGLSDLAAWLAQEAATGDNSRRLLDGFPTAAAAVIGFSPPTFRLFTPKILESEA